MDLEQKVVSTIYGKDIKKIGDKLQLYKTYIISNATVNLQDTKYTIFGYPYQWTLKSFTKTRFHRERIIHPSILKFRFASLQGLTQYIGKKVLIGNNSIQLLTYCNT
ncbi:hypothetical protein ACJIZ3_014246 [Penstemon smallii]|uniref:Uncharacterized protein n=1 Tax=Penstemon smallii TaxID=265156 RepID=A0ABD3RJB1_9LAMI